MIQQADHQMQPVLFEVKWVTFVNIFNGLREIAWLSRSVRQASTPKTLENFHGARESVAAHGLYRLTQQRPGADSPSADPTQRWCSDCGKVRANVTGKSARAVRLHPSWALGPASTEAAAGWRRRTSPVTLPNLWRSA